MTFETFTLPGRPASRGVLVSRLVEALAALVRARQTRAVNDKPVPGVPVRVDELDLTAMLLRN